MFIMAIAFIIIYTAFALGLGYFVLAYANKQENSWIKSIGLVIGGFIILASFLFMLIGSVQALRTKNYFDKKMEIMYKHHKMMEKHHEKMKQCDDYYNDNDEDDEEENDDEVKKEDVKIEEEQTQQEEQMQKESQ